MAQCETDLRELLAYAAKAGDYDKVFKLTAMARQVAVMGAEDSTTSIGASSVSEKPLTAKRKLDAYPRFEKRGDSLVKIGWSKREKQEYEHKAPRLAVETLAQRLGEIGKKGRIFPTSEFLPLIDQSTGTEVPDYQAYLALAWFRFLDLIDQHGRRGYSVSHPEQLTETVNTAWEALPAL